MLHGVCPNNIVIGFLAAAMLPSEKLPSTGTCPFILQDPSALTTVDYYLPVVIGVPPANDSSCHKPQTLTQSKRIKLCTPAYRPLRPATLLFNCNWMDSLVRAAKTKFC